MTINLNSFIVWLILLILFLVVINRLPKYQFYSLKLDNDVYLQLRGNIRTGELEQIYIKDKVINGIEK